MAVALPWHFRSGSDPITDVKVVPADTDRFRNRHGYNTTPSLGAPAAHSSATEKIRAKARLLAGMQLGRRASAGRRGRPGPHTVYRD